MSSDGDAVVLVIPAFNEAATLADLVRRALPHVSAVVVVDDGSSDGTADTLQGLPVTLLVNRRNLGKGHSLWRGMQQAIALGARWVATLDGDGQHDPADLPRLIGAARAHPGQMVIGARLRERASMPRLRAVANRFADFWIAWACGQPIADSQSGFRVYPAEPLARLRAAPLRAARFAFEAQMLIRAAEWGVCSQAVPIVAAYPAGARPSHYRPLADTLRIAGTVAGSLLRRGLYPQGLWRAMHGSKSRLEAARSRP